MKTHFELEREDIQGIAEEVIKQLKPFLQKNNADVFAERIMDVKELAAYLRIDESWVYKQVSLNTIPYFKVGKYDRFKKTEIDAWMEQNSYKQAAPYK